ncbi:hypothetical protein HPB48_021649 [Haemaphysalis longicornis]|uniref:Uncharacterized protein n=1 Tax=Haemaphysalis longicornis TaxID=44386 RepID=A0A9J6F6K5_HAELO|nr:hypothetical protein HPB48_021649 [Haemaphysalis longicornis]
MVCLTLQTKPVPVIKNKECRIPVFSRASDVDVLDALEDSFSSFASFCESDEYSVDYIWRYFKNIVFTAINSFVPFKRKVVRNSNPWVNRAIIRLSRKLQKARKKCKRNPTACNTDKLSSLRLDLKETIKKAKEYYQRFTLKSYLVSSPGKFWRHFSAKKKSIPSIMVDNVVVNEKTEICEALNRYFCLVFTSDNGIMPDFVPCVGAPPIDDVYIRVAVATVRSKPDIGTTWLCATCKGAKLRSGQKSGKSNQEKGVDISDKLAVMNRRITALLPLVSQMNELMTIKETVRNIETAVENLSANYDTLLLTVDSQTKDIADLKARVEKVECSAPTQELIQVKKELNNLEQ